MVTLLEREKEVTNTPNIQTYYNNLREQNIPIAITRIPQKDNCYKISFSSPLPVTKVRNISSELKNLGYPNSVHMIRRNTLAHLRKGRSSNYSSFHIIVRAKTDIPNEPKGPIVLPPPKPQRTTQSQPTRRSNSRRRRR